MAPRQRSGAVSSALVFAGWALGAATTALGVLLLVANVLHASPTAEGLPPALRGSDGKVRYAGTLAADMASPLAVAIGPAGEVYVADSDNGRVVRFDAAGLPSGTIGQKATGAPNPGELTYPLGLALGTAGDLYVSDNAGGRISIFHPDGQFVRYFAEAEDGTRAFGIPGSLFYKDGLLYVSDLGQHRVLLLQADGRVERTLGTGKGSAPGEFSYPGPIWADDAGRTFVSDSNNHRVQVFDRAGAVVGNIADMALNLPRGIAEDSAGRLHIASTLEHHISVFTKEGRYLFSYGSSGSGWDELGFPTGLAIAGAHLYVADRANNRVQVYLLASPER